MSNRTKILLFASNPENTDRLALGEEVRLISKKIQEAKYRDSLEFITTWAVRPSDLLDELNKHKPEIVHFSGHGSGEGGLVLSDDNGELKLIATDILKELFSKLKDNIRLVVLNACFTNIQAQAISEEIDCVIGMNKSFGDDAAISFAGYFYSAIAYGRSISEAFEQGKMSLKLEGIPDENTPVLLHRLGVDPSNVYLIPPITPSPEREYIPSDLKEIKQLIFKRLFLWFKKQSLTLKILFSILLIILFIIISRFNLLGEKIYNYSKELIPFNIPIVDNSLESIAFELNCKIINTIGSRQVLDTDSCYLGEKVVINATSSNDSWIGAFLIGNGKIKQFVDPIRYIKGQNIERLLIPDSLEMKNTVLYLAARSKHIYKKISKNIRKNLQFQEKPVILSEDDYFIKSIIIYCNKNNPYKYLNDVIMDIAVSENYRSEITNGRYIFSPDLEKIEKTAYTDIFELNGDAYFPAFDIKVVNNSSKTIYFTNLEIEVEKSEIDLKAYPKLKEWFGGDFVNNYKLLLYNDGWGEMRDVVFNFNLYKRHFYESPDTVEDYMSAIDDTLKLLPYKYKKELGTVKCFCFIDLSEEVRKFFKSESGIIIGRLNYNEFIDNKWVPASSILSSPIYGAYGGGELQISFTYNNLKFEEDKNNYRKHLPINQYLNPGDVDRFLVKIAPVKSSFHKFRVKLLTGDKYAVLSPKIELNIFTPKEVYYNDEAWLDKVINNPKLCN